MSIKNVVEVNGKSYLVLKEAKDGEEGLVFTKYDNYNFSVSKLSYVTKEGVEKATKMNRNVKVTIGDVKVSAPIAFFSTTDQFFTFLKNNSFQNSNIDNLLDLDKRLSEITPTDIKLKGFLKDNFEDDV